MSDIREGALRGARDDRDTRGSTLRDQRTPDEYTRTFYDELGFAATEGQRDAYMADEEAWQTSYAEEQANVDEIQGTYDEAEAKYNKGVAELVKANNSIPSLDKAVDDAWSSYKSELVGVRVMGPNDKIEATYYLPKDGAQSLVGQRGIFASTHGNNMNVMVKDYRNQELHDSLRTSAKDLETQYKAKASKELAPQLSEAYGSISEGQGMLAETGAELSGYKSQIDTAQGSLDASVASRDAQWEALRTKYQERVSNMETMLGGSTVV